MFVAVLGYVQWSRAAILALCLAGGLSLPAVHRGRPTGGFLGLPKHTAEDRVRASGVQQLWSTQRIDHFNPQVLCGVGWRGVAWRGVAWGGVGWPGW